MVVATINAQCQVCREANEEMLPQDRWVNEREGRGDVVLRCPIGLIVPNVVATGAGS